LPDHPALYDHRKRLVQTHGVIGNQVYDARLAAAMIVHRIGRILTFNAGDFARYGIEVIHPSTVS
jgi:predicted nucleic acid-binding protein